MHIYLGDKKGVKERGGGGKERREVREGGEGRWEVGGGGGGGGGWREAEGEEREGESGSGVQELIVVRLL